MREIKLNDVRYLRQTGSNIKAVIDESNIEFVNGVALVEAKVSSKGLPSGPVSYTSFGLINENFEEVYDDSLEGRTSRRLMFLPCNTSLIRVGESDYLSSYRVGDGNRTWTENCHIRVINGIPTMISELKKIIQTQDSNIITDGCALYDIKEGKFITREYSSIEEIPMKEDGVPTYLAGMEVSSYEYQESGRVPINQKTGIVDTLYFVIDQSDRIISPVYSSLERDWYVRSGGPAYSSITEEWCVEAIDMPFAKFDVDMLIAKRRDELIGLEQRSIQLKHELKTKQYTKLPPNKK